MAVILAGINGVATSAFTAEKANTLVFGQMKGYYSSLSSKKLEIVGGPTDIFGWYDIALTSSWVGSKQEADLLRDVAIKKAEKNGADFSKYNQLIIFYAQDQQKSPADLSFGFPTTTGWLGTAWINVAGGTFSLPYDYKKLYLVSHEFGHVLGLGHASFPSPWALDNNQNDPYELMGYQLSISLNAPHREQLGWLEVPTAETGKEYIIDPLQALKLERARGDWLYIENNPYPFSYSNYVGVLIRRYLPGTGGVTYLFDADLGTAGIALPARQSFVDSKAKITIMVIENLYGNRVKIKIEKQ